MSDYGLRGNELIAKLEADIETERNRAEFAEAELRKALADRDEYYTKWQAATAPKSWPPASPPEMPPYKVEEERPGCQSCGEGRLLMVVGPDGVGVGGRMFADREDADDLAELLNRAYLAGYGDREGTNVLGLVDQWQNQVLEMAPELERLRRIEAAAVKVREMDENEHAVTQVMSLALGALYTSIDREVSDV